MRKAPVSPISPAKLRYQYGSASRGTPAISCPPTGKALGTRVRHQGVLRTVSAQRDAAPSGLLPVVATADRRTPRGGRVASRIASAART
eukprot:1005118-Pleurochrysis_carterae.AAC.1